jgi:hypothetical protein
MNTHSDYGAVGDRSSVRAGCGPIGWEVHGQWTIVGAPTCTSAPISGMVWVDDVASGVLFL